MYMHMQKYTVSNCSPCFTEKACKNEYFVMIDILKEEEEKKKKEERKSNSKNFENS